MTHFELLEQLGAGGYANVYLCRRKDDGADALFALKRISAEKLVTPQQQERARTEQHILATVRSPFLCRSPCPAQQFAQPDENDDNHQDFCSLAMEFIDGRPLYQCVWKYHDRSGRFPDPVAKFFAAQLVLALRALHASGYVHRDLKSGNVLVDQRGFAKVIDFGLAKALGAPPSERTHSFCGTHYIMAPEIFARAAYGCAVDWWSCGVVIYEMVAGRPPWAYKPAAGQSIDAYFASVSALAAQLQTDDAANWESSASASAQWNPALRSLLRGLLTLRPESRLGFGGAAEVMAHPWFADVDWELLEAQETRERDIAVPYDPARDFVDDAMVLPVTSLADELSSAESIDPEDDAKYFGDF